MVEGGAAGSRVHHGDRLDGDLVVGRHRMVIWLWVVVLGVLDFQYPFEDVDPEDGQARKPDRRTRVRVVGVVGAYAAYDGCAREALFVQADVECGMMNEGGDGEAPAAFEVPIAEMERIHV